MLDIPEGAQSDTYTLQYAKTETDFPTDEELKEYKKQGVQISDLYEMPEFIGSHVPYFSDLTDGLAIEIPLKQNVPVLTLRAEDGETVHLSGFELFARGQNIIDFNWDDYGDDILKLYRSDGTVANTGMLIGSGTFSEHEDSDNSGMVSSDGDADSVNMNFSDACTDYTELRFVELIDGVKFKSGKPDTYIGFVDVTDVTAIELAGKMYTKVSE